MSSLLIFAEHRNGKLKKSSFEAISKGKEIADGLGLTPHILLVGDHSVEALANDAAQYGISSVLLVVDDRLSQVANEAIASAISQVAAVKNAGYVLLSATAMGKEVGPFVTIKMGAGLAADVTDLNVENGNLTITRPVFTGKALSTVAIESDKKVISLRPNSFPAKKVEGTAVTEILSVELADKDFRCKVVEVVTGGGKIDVAEADIVVSGGRSLGSAENFKILEDMAATMGAAVGASRAAVDSGYRPHEDQVGQTGKVISPKLYFAIGISGAIQHLAGMNSSKVIVAINKDKDAPIFQVADYGIVGDLFEVVPALTEELKKRLD